MDKPPLKPPQVAQAVPQAEAATQQRQAPRRGAPITWEDGGSSGISGFYYKGENFTLQNLDNPSQFFTEVSAQETHNGMGRIWNVSYSRFNATRLRLSGNQYSGDATPFVFEEIIIGEPDQ